MVVAELAGLGGETKVRDGGNGDVRLGACEREAVGPGAFGFVLQVEG